MRFPQIVRPDPHSNYRQGQPVTKKIIWRVTPDFERKVLRCRAELVFDKPGTVVLDTNNLVILGASMHTNSWSIEYKQFEYDKNILSAPLQMEITDDCFFGRDDEGVPRYVIVVHYETAPDASGLHWLEPEQTLGGRKPFLYTQGQCLGARSFLPCQDTPSIRCPVTIHVTVPEGFIGVACGVPTDESIHCLDGTAVLEFKQAIPIPSYLIALAIGDMECRTLSERSTVCAERELVGQAAEVFADVEKFIAAGEELFGPYVWGQFNIVVLPAAFPFGGMENPGCVFVNAAVAAADKSQLEVIIHELAHHWTGNLVINATWDHFWLNEGWTVWATYMMMRKLFGDDVASLQLALMEVDLIRDLEEFADKPWHTQLRTELHGNDPLDSFSRVPYMKGCFFLLRIMAVIGEKTFLSIVRMYINAFSGRSITTNEFMMFLRNKLTQSELNKIKPWLWCYEAGMPEETPVIESNLMDSILAETVSGLSPAREVTASWNGSAWTYYLSQAARDESLSVALDNEYKLAISPDPDIRTEYLKLALETGAPCVWCPLEEFLSTQGRMKYIVPLYRAILKVNPAWAEATYNQLKAKYHAMARGRLDKIFADASATRVVVV